MAARHHTTAKVVAAAKKNSLNAHFARFRRKEPRSPGRVRRARKR